MNKRDKCSNKTQNLPCNFEITLNVITPHQSNKIASCSEHNIIKLRLLFLKGMHLLFSKNVT